MSLARPSLASTLPARTPLLSAYPHFSALRVYAFGAVLGLVASMDIISTILIAMAGTQVQSGLGAVPQDFLWAFTAYAAAAVVANLVLVQLAGRVSYRRFTLAGLALFIAGALGCAAATSLPALVLARAVQGLGGGGLFAAARILAQYTSQPRERLSLFWGFGLANFALVALAPWLTGVLVAHHGWPLLFLLQAGLAALLLPLVLRLYPREEPLPPRPVGRLDWPGVAAFAAGALLLLHALEQLRYLSAAQLPLLAGIAAAGLGLGLVVLRRFSRHPDPWLDPRRLASRRYLVGLAFYGAFYLVSGAWNYAVPALLAEGLGYGLPGAGALLSLGGAVTLIAVVVFHLSLPRVMRKRRYIALGYLGLALSFALMAWAARAGGASGAVLAAVLLQGAMPVLALLQVALMTFVDMPTEDFAHAYAFKSIVREIVNALGAGLTVLQLHHGTAAAQETLQAPAVAHASLHAAALRAAAGDLLAGLAVACLAVAAIALAQRALK
ncbi:MFS transporter [Azohydromonas caseinilytica]|uniref:Multidrug efflux MFS transporter n=1 Tax=Azohydromonas caseinilytica TaxID=2728836 RepID=A0A848FE32_9BURK|nr:MFS transporter [Azohydromonas caseinilytica]NML16410.1 multidrug efflux MFS transporter [Azohydromonas caseinilytica]